MARFQELVDIYQETKTHYRSQRADADALDEDARAAYEGAKRECLDFVHFLYRHLTDYLEAEDGRDLQLVEEPQFDGAYWGYPVDVRFPDGNGVRVLLAVRISGDYYSARVSAGSHGGDFPVPRGQEGARDVSERAQARKAEPVFDLVFNLVAKTIREDTYGVLEGLRRSS